MSTSHVPPPPPAAFQPGPPVPPRVSAGRRSKAAVVSLVVAALGFVEISFSSSRTVNGVVVDCNYLDLAPWLFGPVALLCGAWALAAVGRGPSAARDRALGAVGVAVGVLHVLRAFGVLELLSGNPC